MASLTKTTARAPGRKGNNDEPVARPTPPLPPNSATDTDKARLFSAARAGHIAVLLGSTEKMGVGTNVQARAVALYHLDCPWRPSDIAQREGRIMRQGNQNAEVAIVRFVTERSFDSYMWQGVERKATFIA